MSSWKKIRKFYWPQIVKNLNTRLKTLVLAPGIQAHGVPAVLRGMLPVFSLKMKFYFYCSTHTQYTVWMICVQANLVGHVS